jgi:NADPH-dependent glutamate synthase beta subunit-like oxidoreductase
MKEPGELLGRLMSRGKVELEKAARRGRDQLHLRQLRNDRDVMYQKLGKEARNLLEAGEIEHPGIRKAVERISELEKRLSESEDAIRVGEQAPVAPESAFKSDK